ncbi:hypothetical protein B0H17DRAFT_1215759 [Mycena rosella]|uniref:Uncharacterized protein n=1 Tax=Mycena rosella TaxID=1033263 RepID=A0AAD7CDE2_MYCRO|nr:hypothetical protein B0H17DRAFT_1215759 [Mycena rosella]
MTMIGIHIVAIMMLLRINALYADKRVVGGCLLLLFMIMFGMNAWLLTRGEPVAHNPQSGVRACTMIFPPDISAIASSSAWLPLLYDSVVLGLTLNKTIPLVKRNNGTFMMKRLLEDGLIYYTAIFTVTLVLTIMIISAPPGLKNIAAQLELLIAVNTVSSSLLWLENLNWNIGRHDVADHPQPQEMRARALQEHDLARSGTVVFQSVWPTTGTVIAPDVYRNPGDW